LKIGLRLKHSHINKYQYQGISISRSLYAINSDQAILADGSVGLPSCRFKNRLSSGIYQSNSSVGVASCGIQFALFIPTEHLVTGQVTTSTLSANSVQSTSGNIITLNSTSFNSNPAVVNNLRITTGARNNYLLRSDSSGKATWVALISAPTMTQYRIVGVDNIT